MPEPSFAERAFWELRADDGTGLRTSIGWLFNHTVFARDVSMIARWILELGPEYQEVSREVILTLCWHQGVAGRDQAEEQLGRIHNEYRKFSVWKAPWSAKLMGQLVSLLWGGNLDEYTTYIAVDTTPLFVMLVCAYAEKVDREILHEVVVRHDGKRVQVKQCLDDAVTWILRQRDDNGLIAARRRNSTSLFYQTWKDSHTALIHANRRLGSLSRPVAYLDTQMLAVDALRAASALFAHERAVDTIVWQEVADRLVATTLKHFWQADEKRFYVAIDRDTRGELRPITTPGSNQGWLLDSSFWDGLPEAEKRAYQESIIRHLLSPAFLTAAGIRSRAVGSDNWLGVADYHGSWTVWPVDTYTFARGLRRQGLPRLAQALEQRITRTVVAAGSFYEYFLVDQAGRVLYQPHQLLAQEKHKLYRQLPRIPVQILPERQLAWTIGLSLVIERGASPDGLPSDWARELQTELAPGLLEPAEPSLAPSFVPAPRRGAWRVAGIASKHWIQEYLLRLS